MDLSKKTDTTDTNTETEPSGICSDSDEHSHLQQQSSGNPPQPSQQSSTNQSQDAALGISEICDPVTVAKCSPRSSQPTECKSSPRATPAEGCGDITGQSYQSLDAYSEVNKAPAQPFNTVNPPSAPSGQGSMPPSYVQLPHSQAAPKAPLQRQSGSSKGNKANKVAITLSAALRSSPTCRDVGHSAPLSTPTTTASSMSQGSGSTDQTDWRASFDQEHRDHVVRRILRYIFGLQVNPAADSDPRMASVIEYARKLENAIYNTAKDMTQYFELLSERCFVLYAALEESRRRREIVMSVSSHNTTPASRLPNDSGTSSDEVVDPKVSS